MKNFSSNESPAGKNHKSDLDRLERKPTEIRFSTLSN